MQGMTERASDFTCKTGAPVPLDEIVDELLQAD